MRNAYYAKRYIVNRGLQMEVVEGIHLIKCPWLNYFVSSIAILDDAITLVDVGASDSPRTAIYPYLKKIGREPSEISRIILTHAHLDHCGGVAQIKKETGCKVYVHKSGKPYVEDADLINKELHERFPSICPRGKPGFESFKADVIFEGGDILELDGRRIHILHTPGHSPDSSCLLDEETGVCIAGDSVQGRGEGRPLLFYSSKEYAKSMRRLLQEPVKVFITGHPFPPFNEAVLRGEQVVKHINESLKGIKELKSQVWEILKEAEKPLSIKQIHEKAIASRAVTIGCILEDLEKEGKVKRERFNGIYKWSVKR